MIHCFVALINSIELTDNKSKRTCVGKRRVKRANNGIKCAVERWECF